MLVKLIFSASTARKKSVSRALKGYGTMSEKKHYCLRVLGKWPQGQKDDEENLRIAVNSLLSDVQGPAGFFGLPWDTKIQEDVVQAVRCTPERFRRVLVLGIGGSALGAKAALETLCAFSTPRAGREVRFLSNLDPTAVRDALECFDPADTLLVVISKSGATTETLTQFLVFSDRIRLESGENGLREGVFIITDPSKGALREIASDIGCRTLDVPPNVGGRFSVLTSVGLFPIGLAGFDITKMLLGARQVAEGLKLEPQLSEPAMSAMLHARVFCNLALRFLWAYGDRLSSFLDWFCQLWAESLGKKRKDGARVGQAPIRAIGTTDQHSLLQLAMDGPDNLCLTFLTFGGPWPDIKVPFWKKHIAELEAFEGRRVLDIFDALRQGTMAALVSRPLLHLHVPHVDEESLGALFMHFEVETALTGYLLGVNPFDQPGVEAGKRFAFGILGRPGFEEYGETAKAFLS